MDNNVVIAVASALVQRSIAALMFNFRGVGYSQGNFGNGIDEQQDVAAALNWLASQVQVDRERLGLMGYSFGAAVALPAACHEQSTKALALVSLPLDPGQIPGMGNCTMPKLMVFGGRDIFVPQEKVEDITKALAEPKQFHVVSGADHFWWGYEKELVETVSQFFCQNL
jgi:alpha/beta superfamily hydrolase